MRCTDWVFCSTAEPMRSAAAAAAAAADDAVCFHLSNRPPLMKESRETAPTSLFYMYCWYDLAPYGIIPGIILRIYLYHIHTILPKGILCIICLPLCDTPYYRCCSCCIYQQYVRALVCCCFCGVYVLYHIIHADNLRRVAQYNNQINHAPRVFHVVGCGLGCCSCTTR